MVLETIENFNEILFRASSTFVSLYEYYYRLESFEISRLDLLFRFSFLLCEKIPLEFSVMSNDVDLCLRRNETFEGKRILGDIESLSLESFSDFENV